MDHHKLVMPENLNHYGFLFGGYILKWVDEVAWIAVSLDYPKCNFVTIAMDNVEFRKSVRQGTILKFTADRVRVGTTSVGYHVGVFHETGQSSESVSIFSTTVTLVRVDDQGHKTPITAERPDSIRGQTGLDSDLE